MKLTNKQIMELVKKGILTAKDVDRLSGKKKKKCSATQKLFRPGKAPLDTSRNIA